MDLTTVEEQSLTGIGILREITENHTLTENLVKDTTIRPQDMRGMIGTTIPKRIGHQPRRICLQKNINNGTKSANN